MKGFLALTAPALLVAGLVAALCGNDTKIHSLSLYTTVNAIATVVGGFTHHEPASEIVGSMNESTTTTLQLITRNNTIFAIPTCTIGHSCFPGFNFTTTPRGLETVSDATSSVPAPDHPPEITVTSFRTITTVVEVTTNIGDSPNMTTSITSTGVVTTVTADPASLNGTSLSTIYLSSASAVPSKDQHKTVICTTLDLPLSSIQAENSSLSTTKDMDTSLFSMEFSKTLDMITLSKSVPNKTISVVPLPVSTEENVTVIKTSLVVLTTLVLPLPSGVLPSVVSSVANTSLTSTTLIFNLTGKPLTNLFPVSTRHRMAMTSTLQATVTPLNLTKSNGSPRIRPFMVFTWLNTLVKYTRAQSTPVVPEMDSQPSGPEDLDHVPPMLVPVAVTITQILTRTTLIQLSALPVSTTFSSLPESVAPLASSAHDGLTSPPGSSFRLTSSFIPFPTYTTLGNASTNNPPQATPITSIPNLLSHSFSLTNTSVNVSELYWTTTADLPSYWNPTTPIPNITITTSSTSSGTPLIKTMSLSEVTKTLVHFNAAASKAAAGTMAKVVARIINDVELLKMLGTVLTAMVIVGTMAVIIL